MKATVLITTYFRDDLLDLGLGSITKGDNEIIVLNDGIPGKCEDICDKHGVSYIFTGQRNVGEPICRMPGFAFNIGIKRSKHDIIILTCAEMYHLNNCLRLLLDEFPGKIMAIPEGKDDRDGMYLESVKQGLNHKQGLYDRCHDLTTKMPFLMAIQKEDLYAIGGYDEDFIGIAFDDNDITDRLLLHGCEYKQTVAKCVHLYHPRTDFMPGRTADYNIRWNHNKTLWKERKGIIQRNIRYDWGWI